MAITKIQSESLNLADDFAFTGTITGAGESNLPYFQLSLSANQTGVGDAVWTKIQFDTADLDSASGADVTTNYRYTVQSGDAGVYLLLLGTSGATQSDTDNKQLSSRIYKNGSDIKTQRFFQSGSSNDILLSGGTACIIESLSVGDYIEGYISINSSSNVATQYIHSGSMLKGFKITS